MWAYGHEYSFESWINIDVDWNTGSPNSERRQIYRESFSIEINI